MAIKINLNNEVYNKTEYEKTIDTSFSQLGVKTPQEQLEEQVSVDKFFTIYEEIFYEIPQKGETNSHEFLIKASSEYIGDEQQNELIELLRQEIADLRAENLELQQQIIEQNS